MDQLNEMVRAGVLRQYALGGAMAAIFYAEPAATYDLDVRARAVLFMQEAEISRPFLSEILERHGFKRHGASSERRSLERS